jgi:hypothetical protein
MAYLNEPKSDPKMKEIESAFQRMENFRIERERKNVEFLGCINDPDARRDYAQALRMERHNLFKSDGNEDYVITLDNTLAKARPRHAKIIKNRNSLIQGAIDSDTWNWIIEAKNTDGT